MYFGEILTAASVPSHNPACQNAKSVGCSCTSCYGILHQNDILRKVVDLHAHSGMNTNSAQTTIASLLTLIYGTRFNTLGDPPSSQKNERCRGKNNGIRISILMVYHSSLTTSSSGVCRVK